jgi:hypothetical protein
VSSWTVFQVQSYAVILAAFQLSVLNHRAVRCAAVRRIIDIYSTSLFERSNCLSHSGSGNETSETKSFRASRSERFFQRIYQQAATGIAITDWLGVFQECNPRMVKKVVQGLDA